MSLPIINFKFTNAEVTEALQDLLTDKLRSIEHFIGEEPDVKLNAEFEKVAEHKSGPIYRIEVNLYLKGELYRAEATMESFEAAIDEVRSELDKELQRARGKKDSLVKKGGRKLKDMIQGGSA